MTLDDSVQEMPASRKGMGRRTALKLLLAGATGTALGAAGYARLSSASKAPETPRIYDAEVSQNGPNIEFVVRDTEPIVLNDNVRDDLKTSGSGLNTFHKFFDVFIDGKSTYYDDQSFLKYNLEVQRVSPHEIKGVIKNVSGAPVLNPGTHNILFSYNTGRQNEYGTVELMPNQSLRRTINFK